MSSYNVDEGSKSSHFFIQTPFENLHVLSFATLPVEKIDFNNDFLQDNVYEMLVAKLSYNSNEIFCKKLAHEIKTEFDRELENNDNRIIFVLIEENSLKHKLIQRFIHSDANDHFAYIKFRYDGKVFMFFYNHKRTQELQAIIALSQYFKEEYDIIFDTDI